ncbi:MAG: hypothetical protein A2V86_16450 [Deltaproteobacteria bacterium RBG_16_49_23]|nr:MAG: hypothetical protein A2V86_16450 [Deltaproteobacteria bacterium RBG_16_49_23]
MLIILLLLPALPAFGESFKESPLQVWKVEEQRWTNEEELNFAGWVEENIAEDFFIRHKIPVDCADVPYAIRWIYARIAGLPAGATTKNDKLIGHWSTDWNHLSTHAEWHKDLRFRKALLHMLSETTTRTLPLDTYPIRIDQESVAPGTMFFVTESHSGVIGHVILDGSSGHPLQTWEATSPAKIQKLSGRDFMTPRPESTVYSGLVKFRWPIFKNGKWEYLPVAEHPFYSLEQYASDFYEGYADFVEAVAKRMDPADYDPWEKMERVLNTTTRYLMDRVPVVEAGYRRCRRGGCREESPLWEIHSTPGRDGRIVLLMDHLRRIIESNHLDLERVRETMEAISIPIQKGQSVTFHHLFQNHLWLSPHPRDSIEARWGLRKCEMIFSQVRTTQSAISFIEKNYRRKDPKYADFATRQQQEILRRLNEEWVRSDCKEPAPPSPKGKMGR